MKYIGKGIELANAFGELTDPQEQRIRSEQDLKKRKALYPHKDLPPIDEEFIEALGLLGEAGGIAVGLDRLVQCLLNKNSLQEVVAFSHHK